MTLSEAAEAIEQERAAAVRAGDTALAERLADVHRAMAVAHNALVWISTHYPGGTARGLSLANAARVQQLASAALRGTWTEEP